MEGFLPVAAVAQGNDPPLAHREHAVGAVIPTPAVVGVNPWRPHADHDLLAVAEMLEVPVWDLAPTAATLEQHGLLQRLEDRNGGPVHAG